jgi:phosphoglycolate phosphatase
MKDYKYYIFDLDGTMVDTCPDLVNTVQYIIRRYGYEERTPEFIRTCIGGGARNVLLKCLGPQAEEHIDNELLDVFREYYTAHCDVDSVVYPGVKEVLEELKSQGKSISVATFKIRSATLKLFDTFELSKYFDTIVTADDVENPKPAPDCINKILEFYSCVPEEAVLIGDTKTDYMTGRNAGVDVCSITYGYNSRDDVLNLGADYVFDSMDEILEELKNTGRAHAE